MLLQTTGPNDLDPFAVDLPQQWFGNTYIQREPIVAEVLRPGTRIVLGEAGIGKSTLYSALVRGIGNSTLYSEPVRLAREATLVVGLPVHEVSAGLSDPSILTGEASLLSPPLLIPRIFEAYWDNTILNDTQRATYLPQLRADKRWMKLVRWFYRHYPPHHPEVDDYELMAWLTAPCETDVLPVTLSLLTTLREVIRLACWQVDPGLFFGSRELRPPYVNVEVLVDGTEQLSPPAVKRLLADAQGLYGLSIGQLDIKLFVDSAWEPQVTGMECVRQGRVNIVALPAWSDDELRQLLRGRLYGLRPGGTTIDHEEMPEYELGYLLASARGVLMQFRKQVESRIIDGAQGSPLHALRLARCIVAAACGCWSDYSRPLSLDSIDAIIKFYQQHVGMSTQRSGIPSDHGNEEAK